MAIRTYYKPMTTAPYYQEFCTEFKYNPGFALSQSRKNIAALHDGIRASENDTDLRILEVSSKSPEMLGVCLSAFNVPYFGNSALRIENVFQASKLYKGESAPHRELLHCSPGDAKKLAATHAQKQLDGFIDLEGDIWQLEPKTAYYDWIYINSVRKYLTKESEKAALLFEYSVFTDIVFNPMRSINCQAKALAMFVGMHSAGLSEEYYSDKTQFVRNYFSTDTVQSEEIHQISLWELQ